MNKKIKIYIPEWIPSGNKGEEAILRGLIAGLKATNFDPEIYLFSYDKETDAKNYGNEVKIVSGMSFRPSGKKGKSPFQQIIDTTKIWLKHIFFAIMYIILKEKVLYLFRAENWKAYSEADIILTGHDGCISDLNIFFTLFCKIIGKKIVIFGGGFKRFKFSLTEKIAKYVIPQIDLIVVRERHSYNYLRSISNSPNIFWYPDPAFFMKPVDNFSLKNLLHKEKLNGLKRPLIGIIAVKGETSYPYFYRIKDKKLRYQTHVYFFSKIIEYIIEYTKGSVVFIPHCIKSITGDDDREVARDIKSKMRRYQDHIFLIEGDYDAKTLKALLGSLDFLISQRLHAVIGAATVSTPFIMVTVKEDLRAYDIINETIQIRDSIFSINNPSIEDFKRMFEEKWNSREKIKKELLKRTTFIEKSCNEAFQRLKDLIK